MNFFENHPLLDHNSFGLDVKAKYFIPIDNTKELPGILNFLKSKSAQILVLGEGSNILFTKDFNGAVLHMKIGGIHVVKEDDHYFWIKAGGGILWDKLVTNTLRADMAGLENLTMIPGTVGAAPVQNIGAYGTEISEVMEALEAFDLHTGEKTYFRNNACAFGYRDSIFKNELKGRYLITNVIFRLNKQPVFNLTYEPLRKRLMESGKKELTAHDISTAVKEIRSEKLPDPAITGNAGSFFKNPVIEKSQWDKLKRRHSNLPGHFLDENHVKIPAAWLIEQCGWKGRRSGHVGVHARQPLVLINTGGATGLEIVRLSEAIRSSVKADFGINLKPEVRIL